MLKWISITQNALQFIREAIYLKGGVLFITSRIIVVDLLKKICPVEKIMGILIYRAHKLVNFNYYVCVLCCVCMHVRVCYVLCACVCSVCMHVCLLCVCVCCACV